MVDGGGAMMQQVRHRNGTVLMEFEGKRLSDGDFRTADLEGANFSMGYLQGVIFCSARLKGANFYGASLEGANFNTANLEHANFNFTQLQGADFQNAQLQGADFQDAQLQGANFSGANLQKARYGSGVPMTLPPVRIDGLPGFRFPVLILDRHVVLGCQILELSEVAQWTHEKAGKVDVVGEAFSRQFKAVLLTLARQAGRQW